MSHPSSNSSLQRCKELFLQTALCSDVILCSIPKLGLLTSTPGRSIAEIFEEEIPNFGENDWEERYLVSPELIAYLQWLIYSAQYKSQDHGARGDEHKKYFDTWIVSFKARWGIYSKKVLNELERLHHENQPKTTSRRKSKV